MLTISTALPFSKLLPLQWSSILRRPQSRFIMRRNPFHMTIKALLALVA